MKKIIKKNTIGIVVKNDLSIKVFKEGKHFISRKYPFYEINTKSSFDEQSLDLESYSYTNDIFDFVEKVIVEENTFMIRYVNKILEGIYKTGIYYFLKTDDIVETVTYSKDDLDLSNLPISTINKLSSKLLAEESTVTNIFLTSTVSFSRFSGVSTATISPLSIIITFSHI